MIRKFTGLCAILLLSGGCAFAQTDQIEPDAGSWKTWVIPSGQDFPLPPPPDDSVTTAELALVKEHLSTSDPRVAEQIIFWDAGSPGYRWLEMVNMRVIDGQPLPPNPHRIYAYLTMAIHDATIAAWDSKYRYNRPRPSELDTALEAKLPTPRSPSYPSEHAVAAGAAATILSHFFPEEAAAFRVMAGEAALSRVYAGLQFPSDVSAGLELGQRVAERVIEFANADGSDAVWEGTVPTGPCMWAGDNPGNVTLPNWKPILLATADEFRPPAPPDCTSDAVKRDVEGIRTFERAFPHSYKAFYWQSPAGITTGFYDYATKWMFEDKLHLNPPQVAKVYSMLAAVFFDAFIASNDAKYAYWYLRPHQLDAEITPLIPVPPFPSYPSNHSTLSTARCEILAYLFPARAEFIRRVGKEAGDSRVWAGIHYQMDNQAGIELGKAIADKFIQWAQTTPN